MNVPSKVRVAAFVVTSGAVALLFAACGADVITCRDSSGGGCTCLSDDSQEGNDAACAPADEGFCCANDAWPEAISVCECTGEWSCRELETFCTCTLGPTSLDAGTPVGSCEPSLRPDPVCCVFEDTCTCGRDDACSENHSQVADCGFATVTELLTAFRCRRNDLAVVDTCVVD